MVKKIKKGPSSKKVVSKKKPKISRSTFVEKKEAKIIERIDVRLAMIKGYGKNGTEEKRVEFGNLLSRYLKQEVGKSVCCNDYNILILFDHLSMMKADSDTIYSAVNNFDNDKPLLLVLFSSGGESGSAYLIGKLCQEFCNNKFIVAIPRHAKSAATLLSCAATEIHMGSLSELGPIDPQIGGKPVLGLKNTIEHIAGLVKRFPASREMFAKYLYLSVEPVQIGYYERVAESAIQYATRLLSTHSKNLEDTPHNIATKLVYDYKDHGFVIDKNEAMEIFGPKVVKNNTPEYKLSNTVYEILSNFHFLAGRLEHNFYFIGSLDSHPNIFKK